MERVDLMAFGAHPDDVEIGAGGLVASEAAKGFKVAIVDLTRGEMGSRGTVELRAQEADAGRAVLGAAWRTNLSIPDRHITIDDANLLSVVRLLREYRPRLILAPYWVDRHPDHVKASELITEAHFASGLKRFCPELPPYRPSCFFYYFINKTAEPAFIADVTAVYDQKRAAVLAHDSQFDGSYPYGLESRDRFFGSQIRKSFGEGYCTRQPLPIASPLSVWGDAK